MARAPKPNSGNSSKLVFPDDFRPDFEGTLELALADRFVADQSEPIFDEADIRANLEREYRPGE